MAFQSGQFLDSVKINVLYKNNWKKLAGENLCTCKNSSKTMKLFSHRLSPLIVHYEGEGTREDR